MHWQTLCMEEGDENNYRNPPLVYSLCLVLAIGAGADFSSPVDMAYPSSFCHHRLHVRRNV